MQLIIISFLAWFIAQLIKFSIRAYKGEPSFSIFYQSGGMPSAHTATIAALSFTTLALYGYDSPIFGLAVIFSGVIIYDALGVRRSTGEQSIAINRLIKVSGKEEAVREVMGHTPKEVAAGLVLGLIVGAVGTFSEWSSKAGWLVESVTDAERSLYLYIFTAFVVVGLIIKLIVNRYRLVEVIYSLKSAIWWSLILPGVLGLFFGLLQFQTNGLGAARLWPVTILSTVVLSQFVLFFRLYKGIADKYRQQADELKLLRKSQRKSAKRNKQRSSRNRKK